MEFMLIHTPRGINPPEVVARNLELMKKFFAKPDDFVPGGKLIATYGARTKMFIVCIVDVPSAEALCPFLEQIMIAGWDTDVMPAEKTTVCIEKLEKALKAMRK
jgi:hypothetical protein